MSISLALVTLVAVAFVNLASTEESMGLCYRCPLQKFENNEGSVFAWVKSFLQEMRRKCPNLKTTRRVTEPPNTSAYTKASTTAADPLAATNDLSTTTIDLQTTTSDLPTTTTDPPTTTTDPLTTTTDPPTTTIDLPTTTTDLPTTTTDPPTTTTDTPTTTTDPPTTTIDLPTTTTDLPTTTTDPRTTTTNTPTTTTDPPTTTIDLPTTTTDLPTTTTDPPTTTIDPPTTATTTTTTTTTTEPSTTTPIAPTPPLNAAADCQALLDAGNTASGVYTIYPTQYPGGLEVRCDMTTASKAWIVFQRRVDGSVSFIRTWAEYRDGFGDKEGEFWLGNEILRGLTEPVDGEQGWQMRVDLVVDGNSNELFALYDDFRISGGLYTLSLKPNDAAYIGDSLSPPQAGNGHPFTTHDMDNDEDTAMNCADTLKGGWWWDNCGTKDNSVTGLVYSNLNGEYNGQKMGTLAFVRGIMWSKYDRVFSGTEMKMRRAN